MDIKMDIENSKENLNNHKYRDYYYYYDDNTKIDVKFYDNGDNKIRKIESTYIIEEFPESVAAKIKERMKWAKFGDAMNSNLQEGITKSGDEVFLEFNPDLKKTFFHKSEPRKTSNEKVYYDDITKAFSDPNIQSNDILKLYHQYFKDDKKDNKKDNKIENKVEIKHEVKKSIIRCRHCGSYEHWSVGCPIQVEKQKEIDDKKEEEKQKEYELQKELELKNRAELCGLKIVELPTDLLDYEIRDHLSKFGRITYFFYVKHKKSKKFTGNVYVTYSSKKENEDAFENIPKKPLGYIFPTVEYSKS
jgi:hypothetical protein